MLFFFFFFFFFLILFFFFIYFFFLLTGWTKRALKTLTFLDLRFPNDAAVQNELGVTHLLLGRNEEAKTTFQDVSS